MKRPALARRKTLTPESLADLGAERLASILLGVADTRPDLKRRLRMEVAAGQGAEHLVPQIDKRLATLQISRGQVGWRQKPAVVRDLDALRELIVDRLSELDAGAALERLWTFLATATPVRRRFHDADAAVSAVYLAAAGDLGRLLAAHDPQLAAGLLVEAIVAGPEAWAEWLPATLAHTSVGLAKIALKEVRGRQAKSAGWLTVIRHLADAAGDVDAYRHSYSSQALATPAVSVAIARRYLARGDVQAAGDILRSAAPHADRSGRLMRPDFEWETAWIDYLEQAGDTAGAQVVRWASFERTLDPDRARAFMKQLTDFDDVEAEGRAFAYAAEYPDFERGLRFLIAWPALLEASRMILARKDDIKVDAPEAESWSAKLRSRYPAAARLLLRRAADAAFRRREFKVCARLTEEAETIIL